MAEEVKMLEEEKVMAMTLHETVDAIAYHNRKYWVDSEPEISDESYDLLVRHLNFLAPDHPLLSQVHAPVVASSGKVIHTDPMLSLDKAYSLDEVISWAEKFIRSKEELLLIQPKYDGISAIWKDGILATRGDGLEGEDITDKLPLLELEHPEGIFPLADFKKDARGEIVIRTDDFKVLYSNIRNKNGRIYKNPRNAVAGIMGLKDITLMLYQKAKLSFIDYSLHSMQCSFGQLREKWDSFVEKIEALPYPMDGIVIKLADREYSRSLGNTAHHPRGQIAFKFSGVRKETILKDVQWSFGKNALTPVALIEPVEISGTTIRHVSLHNLQNILDRDIHIGDIVTVERAGDVIPYILDSRPAGEGAERKNCIITHCPSCGQELKRDLPELRCVNTQCPETLLARLVSSVKNIGIEHLGEPNIRRMMQELSVRSLKDIFALKIEDIVKLEGFAEKSATNLFEEIQNARSVPDWQILASMNIKGIGPNIAKSILKEHTLQELENMSEESLASLDQIGPERAGAIKKELLSQKEYLDELLNVLTVKVSKKEPGSSSEGEKPTICFTGKMPEKRSYYENLATQYGYEAVDSVTGTLSLLVTADSASTSSKIKKAEKAGVKIMLLDDFLASLKGKTNSENTQKTEDAKSPVQGEFLF